LRAEDYKAQCTQSTMTEALTPVLMILDNQFTTDLSG